ncbi:MAG: hypothetical protein KBT34_10710 [Prevotella sp.]|nr:hypothetical protein [Candidatus Prevotella equi]
MKHTPLDIYDDMPRAMKAYISHNGFHFNKKAFECAVKQMKRKNPASGKLEAIEPWSKEQVEELLVKYGVTLDNCVMYDAAYQANWCKADLYKSSVADEAHVALFIKDTLDDADGSDELPFRYWLQKCVALGMPVDFEDLM